MPNYQTYQKFNYDSLAKTRDKFEQLKKDAFINQRTYQMNTQTGEMVMIDEVGIRKHFDEDLFTMEGE
jgi:hypothetical protein